MARPRLKLQTMFIAATIVGWVTPGAGQYARAEGDVAKGRELARTHCARCHVVSEENRFSGISSTPSFMILVEALPDWEERFQTFFARRPHPVHVRVRGETPLTDLPPNATPFEIGLEDVEHILAYVRTFAKE